MKLILQRVKKAAVTVDGETVGKIEKGLFVLIGVGESDTEENAEWLINKLSVLRLFEDADGKTNLSLQEVDGALLLVSQFTLYGDCRKGSRPSFSAAASAEKAEALYRYFVKRCKEIFPKVATGKFGADMEINAVCDGPFTVTLEH